MTLIDPEGLLIGHEEILCVTLCLLRELCGEISIGHELLLRNYE